MLVVGSLLATLLFVELTLQVASYLRRGEQESFVPSASVGHRSDGSVGILALGESTTHGFGVTPYPVLLAEELRERVPGTSFEVINAGIPGTHSPYLVGRIETLIRRHRPDWVIAMMGVNDEVYFTALESRSPGFLPTRFQAMLLRSRVYKLARLLWTNARRALDQEAEAPIDRVHLRHYRRAFEELRPRLLDDSGGQAVPGLQDLVATARGSGRVLPDGTLSIPEPYWHIYEIAQRHLVEFWVERGEFAQAEAFLEQSIALHPKNPRLRRRQIWVLEARSDPVRVREVRNALAALEGAQMLEVTADSWRTLAQHLREAEIGLVVLQYPLREVGGLKALLSDYPEVLYVENVENFRRAVAESGWTDVFMDRFAGDFGHATEKGNQLIADQLVEKIFRPYYQPDGEALSPGE